MTKTVRILSIDGGGVRGIIPALVLATLEAITGRPVHKMFDLISGTSTGGIIACGLTRPGAPSAAALADLYIQQSSNIFRRSALRSFGSLFSAPKYDGLVLEQVLYKQFSDAWLSQSLTNVLIPSYDIERRQALFFKSWHAALSPDDNYPTREVVRATCAAPTYFAPAMVMSDSGIKHACIDGSMVANNPAMCAIASARHLYPDAERMVILSLGVGEQADPIRYGDAIGWGKLSWAQPVIDVMMDGITETVDYQIREALADHTHYLRIQTRLGDKPNSPTDAIDDGSSENIARLVVRGLEVARASEYDLSILAEKLT